jgi:hypothetical protein
MKGHTSKDCWTGEETRIKGRKNGVNQAKKRPLLLLNRRKMKKDY